MHGPKLHIRLFSAVLLLLFLSPSDLDAQRKKKERKKEKEAQEQVMPGDDLIEFSGIIRDLQHKPLPHVNIIIVNDRRGTTSDDRGLFSFVVHENDSILFSHLGYKSTMHVIPDSLNGQQYPADIFMVSDTFHLAEVRIYPWKTYEDFKEDFLALELQTEDEKRAYHNIALIKTQIKMNPNSPNANVNFREVMKQEYNQLYSAGQYPYYTIFDPGRWAKFFKALKAGDFKND